MGGSITAIGPASSHDLSVGVHRRRSHHPAESSSHRCERPLRSAEKGRRNSDKQTRPAC